MRLARKQGEFSKTLIELKVKVNELDTIREEVKKLKPENVGIFDQTDTYFRASHGRLKVREINGKPEVQVVYYKRKDMKGPKRSDILIFTAKPARIVKELLASVHGTWLVVEKRREIFRFKGTQIHLDTVRGLGNFVEFERPSKGTVYAIRNDREILEKLFVRLGLDSHNLVRGSYSDLIESVRFNGSVPTM